MAEVCQAMKLVDLWKRHLGKKKSARPQQIRKPLRGWSSI
jgi:hypothetical protein